MDPVGQNAGSVLVRRVEAQAYELPELSKDGVQAGELEEVADADLVVQEHLPANRTGDKLDRGRRCAKIKARAGIVQPQSPQPRPDVCLGDRPPDEDLAAGDRDIGILGHRAADAVVEGLLGGAEVNPHGAGGFRGRAPVPSGIVLRQLDERTVDPGANGLDHRRGVLLGAEAEFLQPAFADIGQDQGFSPVAIGHLRRETERLELEVRQIGRQDESCGVTLHVGFVEQGPQAKHGTRDSLNKATRSNLEVGYSVPVSLSTGACGRQCGGLWCVATGMSDVGQPPSAVLVRADFRSLQDFGSLLKVCWAIRHSRGRLCHSHK